MTAGAVVPVVKSEEHHSGCVQCSERLRSIAQLAKDIRGATCDGNLHAVVTAPFIKRLQQTGIRVREYRLQPGGSVTCTITPQDDLVVAHLHAPLRDVQRLDLVLRDITAGTTQRMNDVAFDPSADEVVLVPNATQLRQVYSETQRAELFAVEKAVERAIGEYTFNHFATLG